MKNLLTLDYWFNLAPEPLILAAQKLFIALVIGLALAALIIALVKSRSGLYRGFLKRLYAFCLANSAIGLLLLFFNYESAPFLSARFWLGLWVIAMIIWLIPILKNIAAIPKRKKEIAQEKELKKYLPK